VDPLALAFIALAAVLHATWNVLLKTAGDPLLMAAFGIGVASAALVPAVVVGWWVLGRPDVPAEAWVVGVVSGLVEVAYFVFLTGAYRRGDLSLVYPLARGSAPLLAIALGVGVLGERLPPAATAGMLLLVAGLLVVQRPWNLLRAAAVHDRSAAGLALLTGAMIATYSALDRVGVQLTPTWLYAAILWPTCAVGLGLLVLVRGRAGTVMPLLAAPVGSPQLLRGRAAAAGLLTFSAYALVLAALSRAPLALVAPLRESAVLLASTWGVLRLGEGAGRREIAFRVAGAVTVLAGASVLAIAR
jgi:drug/metabolite transporter (DMT)-like permease